jgi:hypothetical protein
MELRTTLRIPCGSGNDLPANNYLKLIVEVFRRTEEG